MIARNLKRFLITSMAAAATAAAIALPAGAAQPGVVADLSWGISDADKQRSASALSDLGSQWVRLDIQWKILEPQNDQYNLTRLADFEKAVDMARAAGQKVLVMTYDAPAWASGSASSNVPTDPKTYADFMAYMAKRLGPKVDAWEVWNEQNLQRFWSTGVNASKYTQLLKATYPAIKAADPGSPVLFGGLSQNDYKYVEAAYAAGAKGYFDVMAVHPYTEYQTGSPRDVKYNSDGRLSSQAFFAYREVRKSMADRGDAKPIWFTEFGWSSSSVKANPSAGVWQGGVGTTKQAEYTYDALKLIEQDSYVQVAMHYNLRNNYWEHDADTVEAQFGLLTTNYSPKPAYSAFRAYAHGQPGPTGTDGGSTTTDGGSTTTEPVRVKLKVRKNQKSLSRLTSGTGTAKTATKAVGRVRGAGTGRVKLVLQKRSKGGWKKVGTARTKVNHSGRFSRVLSHPSGKLRVRASYRSTDGKRASSGFVSFNA